MLLRESGLCYRWFMSELDEWNKTVIAEFRANGGKVGGQLEKTVVVLLHHRGRKTGTERINPLASQVLDHGWAIFASKAGAPTDPEWYLNLVASPRTTIEIGTETVKVVARTAEGAERETIWETQKERFPGFADYEVQAAPRVIPVVILEPAT